jgi:ketosteroid isomerase-like protein
MKHIILACVLLLSHAVYAQKSGREAEIETTIIQFFTALSQLDINKMKLYCSEDIQVLENGTVWNMDSLVANTSKMKGTNFRRSNTLDFIRTEVQGNVAWATYNNRANVTVNGSTMVIRWLETVILERKNKQWWIQVLHSTLIEKRAK